MKMDAPGLCWRKNGNGTKRAYWRRSKADKHYKPSVVRLWAGIEPTPAELEAIAEKCRRLQTEMVTSRVFPTALRVGRLIATGTIYFIEGGGLVKVGFTEKPEGVAQRLCQLQIGSPVHLQLLATIPGSRVDEVMIQRYLQAYRVRGEWFRPCAEMYAIMEGSKIEQPRATLG